MTRRILILTCVMVLLAALVLLLSRGSPTASPIADSASSSTPTAGLAQTSPTPAASPSSSLPVAAHSAPAVSTPHTGGSPGAPGPSPTAAAGSPSLTQPAATSSPSPAANAAPSSSAGPLVSVSCSGMSPTMKLDSTFSMTYDILSPSVQQVALGAALYDSTGADQADGTGDENVVSLAVGHTSNTRSVLIPASITPGSYEVDGEVWPASQIGNGDPLASSSCGIIQVVS